AVYTDLSPGNYKFFVSGIGARRGATRALEIEIVPPFYRSRIAMVLYILLLGLILFLLARQWDNFRQMKMLRKVERLQAETQKELYDAKINFFTNITHEIRTPLSLIKMPLDKIISSGNYTESNQQELLTMQKNTDRLLNLTNQLLDLRKMEKMEVKPTFLSNDLAALVRRTCDRFLNMAEDQHIRMDVTLPETPFPVDCAAEMVDKIIGNLVSNACKYGNGYVRVALEPLPGDERVRVRVDSDGERIPEGDVEQIFEKFYQGTPARQGKGTGLGLPYARSLAALHGGTLTLDRSVKEYNSFVLELPVHQEATVEMPPAREKEAEETHAPVDNLLHTILVVEDDPEMRGYLAKELSELYNVLVAANGEDALKLVESQRIDLVVSDIMMPGIDGVALCNRIKSTTEYCHIPVILLTAAVGMETRIETLDAGADGYIEKPFAIELLQANIANLFKNREIANRQFTQSPLTHFNSMVTGGMDQEFMERLHETVMKHLSEPDLNIETLTSELGTSKSTLYRKVTANTGLNINEYIRVSRLKKAAEMLSSQKYRISEVAYMTGFSSPSYFATCFQKQFNVSPSTFVKGLKG
ncbi:MAG: response regulator, partial [Bacteroidales bacterium]|nr:response regulator [Bacteroidales bacterium]